MAYSGKFKPKNPSKYRGDYTKIIYRSLKERQVMAFLDQCKDCLEWGSEVTVVQYLYDVDQKPHRYFVDFDTKFKTKSGKIVEHIIEYKPASQCIPPKPSKTNNWKAKKRYLNESLTYVKNQNKWDAATLYAEKLGKKFIVISEHDIKDMIVFKTIVDDDDAVIIKT